MPQIGWLLVFLIAVLPGIIVLGTRKTIPNRAALRGSYLLQAVLTLVGMTVIFNARVSPWPLFMWRPLLVTPYVFVAAWLGYLAGYWCVMLADKHPFETQVQAASRRVLRTVYVPLLVAIVIVTFVRNVGTANGAHARGIIRLAEQVVDEMDGRTWLVSNGVLDNGIALAAAERNVPIQIMDMSRSGHAPYLEYMTTRFDDPRLKGLARIGLGPLLSEWFARTPGIEKKVAILAHPDFWLSAQYVVLPAKVLFNASSDVSSVDPDTVMAEHREFWKECVAPVQRAGRTSRLIAGYHAWGLQHMSKVANNLGVLMEDLGRDEYALEAYTQAREIEPKNLSALLNLVSLCKRMAHPDTSGLESELKTVLANQRLRLDVWSLGYHYGYVRSPDVFLTRGWAWAMSGKRNLAIADMQRAMELGASGTAVQFALASLYFREDMEEKSEEAFTAVLEDNPDHIPSILGLARLATRRGDYDVASGYLQRLRDLGLPEGQLRLEEVVLEAMAGSAAKAKSLLEDLVEDDPENLRAWAALAVLAAREDDVKTTDECIAQLEEEKTDLPSIRFALAQLFATRGRYELARRHVEAVTRIAPANQEALEMLLRLDLAEARRDQAEVHVERLLNVDPKNALGNYVLGGLQMLREEYALAETSFRVSLEGERTADVLNELAWVLQRRGAYEEALPMAREAVKMNPRHGAAWDTLGVILLGLDRLDEAEEALRTSVENRPSSLNTSLHMAQLYEKKGMHKEALRLADSLLERPAEMEPDAYEAVRDLVKRLRSSGS
jgi:tetratricopeptide (TPR) repeat protein